MTKARATAAIMMLAMLAVAPLLVAPLGAQQLSDRAKQIGGKFMCMCTCSQVLTQCNHIGCTTSAGIRDESVCGTAEIRFQFGCLGIAERLSFRGHRAGHFRDRPLAKAPGATSGARGRHSGNF